MKYEDAKERLASHANLPGTDLPIEGSFVGGLWLFSQNKAELRFGAHSDDVIRCLRVVNAHFNGPDPNTRSGPADHSRIAEVAYSVSGILSEGMMYHLKWSRKGQLDAQVLEYLSCELCRIAHAWDQILAGDVTDILEGFDIEME